MHTVTARVVLLSFVTVSASLTSAHADEPAAPPPVETPEVVEARREFMQGAELVKSERWAEALAAFERAAAHKSHAITSYNLGQCERALGQYTRARRSLIAALQQNDDSGARELPPSAVVEARGLLAEIERILPNVEVNLRPEDAAIAIDGRPLDPLPKAAAGSAKSDAPSDAPSDVPAFVAGVLLPGPGTPPNAARFRVVMNPGAHVLTVSRRGYQDVVLNRTFSAASAARLDLELDRLPATLHVTSNLSDAIVRVNGADVGNPPVEVSRNAGSYRVSVSRSGFVSYETETTVRPGERVELAATLREDRPALTQRWWFWTAAGALVVGAATTTYFVTRSDPQPTRPPTDGGGLGWSLKVQ